MDEMREGGTLTNSLKCKVKFLTRVKDSYILYANLLRAYANSKSIGAKLGEVVTFYSAGILKNIL